MGSEFSAISMQSDITLRKKLNELLDLKKSIEEEIKNSKNPITEEENKKMLKQVDEIIGKIRYTSLDRLNVLESDEKERIKKSIQILTNKGE